MGVQYRSRPRPHFLRMACRFCFLSFWLALPWPAARGASSLVLPWLGSIAGGEGWSGGALVVVLGGWIIALHRANRRHAQTAAGLKAMTEAARESEQRWKLLFEQSPLSVQIFRPDGQTLRVNAAWMRLFRLTAEQGAAFNVLDDPDLNASGAVHLIRKAFAGEAIEVPPVPYPVSQDPPEFRWIGGVLYPLKNEAGQVLEVVTVHHDITETKRAEEAMLALNHTLEQRVTERTTALQAAQEDLSRALEIERELNELKSRFVSMVSHEFRTPLGITMSAVELLRHYEERLPKVEREQLYHDIHAATLHMGGLMEQVLLLGRVDAGNLAFKPIPLDLDALARKLADESLSATNRKCLIEWTAENDLSGAFADEALLRHIFANLLSNAVKYSPAGSLVFFTARREGVRAIFTLRDSGIGIPAADLPTLFEAFHRGSNVGDIPGTGLGLVISQRCAELHGGSIQVHSRPGEGSVFTVNVKAWA
jgi:PAS domain S-box-containing protein